MFDRLLRRRRLPTAPPPPLRSACYAPHSALYFQPDGIVRACCVTAFAVGSVVGPERPTLREIWDGAVMASQRHALEAGDFHLGCQECEVIAAAGGREATVAHHFDRFADGAPHEFPKLLDLALSSRCNLQCIMCNGELSSAIRVNRDGLAPLPGSYDDRFFEELDEFLPHVERFQFKGGEPFLAWENRRIWDRLIELGLSPEVTVTTNGTLLNDDVERYVQQLRMQPNISVDGMTAETLESIRVGVRSDKLWRNIDRFQELGEAAGTGMTLSFCLMKMNWREVLPFLREADRRRVNCNVIFVNQPTEYDLLRLPHDELASVRRELAGQAAEFVTAEPQRIWTEILTRLDAQLEHPVEIVVRVPVDNLDRPGRPVDPDPPVDAAVQQRLRSALVRRHGREPLTATADADGVIRELDEPDWAEWLGAATFVGRPMESIGQVIQSEVGDIRVEVLPSEVMGVEQLAIEVDAPSGRRYLQLQRFVDESTGHSCAFLTEVGEASASAGD